MKRTNKIGNLLITALFLLILALPIATLSTLEMPVSAEEEEEKTYQPSEEIKEKRGRTHRVYQGETPDTYVAEFVGSPEFTRSIEDNSWIEYAFTDYGNYYAIQHPWWSVAFYDYYTEVYDETFTEVKIYDDRWIVEYQNKQGRWTDSGFWGVVRSYEIVEDGIKLKRTGSTDIGQREEVYYFRNGSPCKIEINQTCNQAQTIQFVWKPSGIVADTESPILPDEDDKHAGKVSGLNYYDSEGKFLQTIRWYDELDICSSITPVVEASAQGRKATITFGGFAINAGGIACLDPTTFYPDLHPEVTSVDGRAQQNYALGGGQVWAVIIAAAGTHGYDDEADSVSVMIKCDNQGNDWKTILRGIYLFDTSSLDDTCIIDSANFSVYGMDKADNIGITPDINLFDSDPASNIAIVAGDYDEPSYPTRYCDTPITFAGYNVAGYNDFVVNAAGLAAISKTGVTKMGLRNDNYDYLGVVPPAWVDSAFSRFHNYFSEQGAGFKPKLVVYWHLPPVPPVPPVPVSEAVVDPRDPSLPYLEIRPDLDETDIVILGVPTTVQIGVFKGYSLPIWASDNEDLYYSVGITDSWDEENDIFIEVVSALSTVNESGNAYQLDLAWEQVTPNVEVVPATSHNLSILRDDLSDLQYYCYRDYFTINYDAVAIDPIIRDDELAFNLRRSTANASGNFTNLSGELIVLYVGVLFPRNDVIMEADMEEIGIQFGIFNEILPLFLGWLFIVGISTFAFWRFNPLLFILVAGASMLFGLYYFDVFTTNLGLTIGLMLIAYSLVCMGFAFRCIFWKDRLREED